ncbi:MAG: hypothetical protein HKN93_00920 [Acidimicrobiia bacterium]|nr:hypothetical protein [Acidimicrobiia bacterium]
MTLLDPRQWHLSSVDRRTLLGVALAAAAAILVVVVTRPPETSPVLYAQEPVPAGAALGSVDLGVRMVSDPEGLVLGDSVGELSEWTVAVALSEGEPLTPSVLRPPTDTARGNEMALSLPPSHAVQGLIAVGDTVDVFATFDDPGQPARTDLIASGVEIVSASSRPSDRSSTVDLVLRVDDETAAALAHAMRTAELDLVRRPAP